MYTIPEYGEMIADRVRLDAYARALRQAVRPGAVVVDIGAGTGIFALLACRFGARRVYAIEAGDALVVARELAAANHCADRIEFIAGFSTEVTLPERADVIVSDLRGILPLYEQSVKSLADARARFLAPGGVMIPRSDTLWAAVVEDVPSYSRVTAAWSEISYGLDLSAARHVTTNMLGKTRVKPEQLLVEPQCWARIDYTGVTEPNVSAQVGWSVMRAGTGHGLCVWFDTELAEGVSFSSGPGAAEVIYGQMFFPWPEPIALAAGDAVTAGLHANLVGEDYVWSWETCVRQQNAGGAPKANFKQSTFFGRPLSPQQLRKRAASHVPELKDWGQIDRYLLEQMDGQTSQEEIARRAVAHFPARFARWEDALARVGELSEKYSR